MMKAVELGEEVNVSGIVPPSIVNGRQKPRVELTEELQSQFLRKCCHISGSHTLL